MKYHYRCPKCNEWVSIDWEDREKLFKCHNNKGTYKPHTPKEQPDSYVNQHNWPKEMEDSVYKDKGTKCTVPGCTKKADTLDHRIPWKKSEKGTSYENLFPMCGDHNSSKGDKDYKEWLKENKLG